MPYIIGIPKESLPGERRVAATPETAKKLIERGLAVQVERGAGAAADYDDAAYTAAGAKVVDDAYSGASAIFKVRPPSLAEVARIPLGALVVSLMQPDRNPGLLDALRARQTTPLALERIPRVTRAQKMDVLSSMGNLSGYRALVEAIYRFPGFMGPQVTAAGSSPPARILVIGAGVAGLAVIGAARALGADVRAFDTRAAAREQVESLGATFLEVSITESGEGQGGYAKAMTPEFIAAEMALFKEQAAEVHIIVTTALVPGSRAPVILKRDAVEAMRPGSVVVDMAAEQGGNCELTVPGEAVIHNGVSILGYTDLPSRMASTASRLFATNLFNLAGEMGAGDTLRLDTANDIIRPALLAFQGAELPPVVVQAAPVEEKRILPLPTEKPEQLRINSPTRSAWGATLGGIVLLVALFLVGRFAPRDLLQHSTVFVLACFVGWQVVWSVTPALHTPLMSVTNAISGIVIIGGILQVGGTLNLATVMGVAAVLFASINVTGGFLVTQRMLRMFRRKPTDGAR